MNFGKRIAIAKITITKQGVTRQITANKRRLAQLNSPIKTFRLASLLMIKWVNRNFEAEGRLHDRKGLHWKELSEFTLRQRRKGNQSVKILQDTGRLRGGFINGANNNFGWVKSNVGYSSTHEFGKGKGPGSTPKRKIFPTNLQALKIVLPAFEQFAKELVK